MSARRTTLLTVLPILTGLLFLGSGCALQTQNPQAVFRQQLATAVEALNKGDTNAADAALSRAVGMAGNSSSAAIEAGRYLMDRGRGAGATGAARFLGSAVKNPDQGWDPLLWATLAEARRRMGDDAGAQSAHDEAEKRAEQVERTADRPSGDDPQTLQRLLQLGLYYHESRKDTPAALRVWRKAYALAPTNPVVLNILGYTLADEGRTRRDFQEALKLTREAVQRAPGQPHIQDSFGWALFKMGGEENWKSARRELAEAADAAPEIPEIRYHLGVVYASLGLTREADVELATALRLRPHYPEAEAARRRLRQPLGQGIIEGT